MNSIKQNCSLNDATKLRNLIIENPELPLLIFCGEDSWRDEFPYEQANVNREEIKELTLYKNNWVDKDDYEEMLSNDLCEEARYRNLPDKEFEKMIKQKIEETEFIKAIVIYVG